MKRAWTIISVIVLAAVLLGTICVGVGIMTGADIARTFSVLDSRYHFDLWTETYQQSYAVITDTVNAMF